MQKYHNVKTVVDGIKFDSRKEANRYCELKLLEKAGEIRELTLQESWVLIPAFTKDGKHYRAIYYVSDFSYYDKDDKYIVEDVKGFKTAVFQLKRKMFEYKYPNLTLKLI